MSNLQTPEQMLRYIDWHVIKRLDGLFAGEYHTLFRGLGLDLADLRAYRPPDDVRHIDWNVTARLQTPYVRVFHEDRDLTAWFLIDQSASMKAGLTGARKYATAVQLAAVLARLVTRRGNRFGAILFGDGDLTVLPERGGKQHILHLLQKAHSTRAPERTPTDLAGTFRRAGRLIRRRSALFVISDFTSTPGWARPLGALQRPHDIVACRVVDPAETDLIDLGIVPMQDAETGEQLIVDTSSRTFRKAYAEEVAAEDRRIIDSLLEARVDAVEISTEESLINAVVRFAGLREAETRQAAG